MCELFAMSSRTPSPVSYSLHEFASHGGERFRNKDGWGIALYQDTDAYLFKEPLPAADSALARLVERENIQTRQMIAHVRLATVGKPSLENTHPFHRTLAGRAHYFAHNGGLSAYVDSANDPAIRKEMLGQTDSEYVFCELLARISEQNISGSPSSLERRFEIFSSFARELAGFGTANILYCDGEALFVHAHRRRAQGNDAPLGKDASAGLTAPGLNIWSPPVTEGRFHWKVKGAHIADIDPQTVLIASVPLDHRDWEPLPENTSIMFRHGLELYRH